MYNDNQIQYTTPNHKYKTQLCRHYSQNGTCAMAQKCQFAHGQEELRSMNDPIPNGAQIQSVYYTPQMQYKKPELQQQQQSQSYIQQQATQQILVVILINMEKVFLNDQTILYQLKQGQELANAGNIHGASDIIKKIINDPLRTKEEKQMYQTIYENAQKIYHGLINQNKQQ